MYTAGSTLFQSLCNCININVAQEMTDLMLSHINSYPREVKKNYSPIELFKIIYGEELLNKLNIKHIEFDNIILNKKLFKS